MKAIHNRKKNYSYNNNTVFNTSKIQNESNSQHGWFARNGQFDCVQYVKDTK